MIRPSVYIKSYPTISTTTTSTSSTTTPEHYWPHHGISLLVKQCLNELDRSISRLPNNCHIILTGC